MTAQAGTTTRPTILVVGEAITAFMHYPTDAPLTFHGPFPSGAPVIFASAAARLGAHVELAAGVGDDMFGAQFRERLTRTGSRRDASWSTRIAPTAAVFVAYEADGTRSFMFHLEGTAGPPGRRLGARPRRTGGLAPRLGGDALVGGPLGSTAWLAVERAIAADIPISFDPNVRATELSGRFRRQFDILLGVARVVLASAGELEALGGSQAAIVERGGAVCYKAGAAGATVVTPDGRWTVPAPEGDRGRPRRGRRHLRRGYVVAAAMGEEPPDCARVGVAVASASVEVKGPLESTSTPSSGISRAPLGPRAPDPPV